MTSAALVPLLWPHLGGVGWLAGPGPAGGLCRLGLMWHSPQVPQLCPGGAEAQHQGQSDGGLPQRGHDSLHAAQVGTPSGGGGRGECCGSMCTLTCQTRWCLRGNVCVVSWRGSFRVPQAPCLPGPAGHWHCSSKKAICGYVGF